MTANETLNTEAFIKKLKSRIRHTERRLGEVLKQQAAYKANNTKLTVHAGWKHGYFDGKLAGLQDTLDDLNDLLETTEPENESTTDTQKGDE